MRATATAPGVASKLLCEQRVHAVYETSSAACTRQVRQRNKKQATRARTLRSHQEAQLQLRILSLCPRPWWQLW